MKHKLFTITALAASLALIFASCQQEPVGPEGLEGDIDIALQMEDLATKVDVNGNNGECTWTAGDKIGIWIDNDSAGGGYQEATVNTGSNTVHLAMTPEMSLAGYAVSPLIMAAGSAAAPQVEYLATYSMSGLTLTSPAFSYVPMMAVNNAELLRFYHVGGLLRLILDNVPDGTVKITVTFEGMDQVTGTATVTNPGTSKATTAFASAETDKNVVTFTNVTRSAETMYLNVPIPSIDFSALTAVRIECFDSGDNSLDTVSKGIIGSWGTIKHGYGRILAADFTADVLSGVRLSSTAAVTMWKSKTVQRTATALDTYGRTYSDATIVWSTSDATIASVDAASGLVTAVKAGGPVTITATATPNIGGTPYSATYQVYVNAVTGISVADSHKVGVGATKTITATLTNSNNGTINGYPADLVVSWVSSNTSKVTVASATTAPTRVNSTTMTASVVVTGVAEGSATLTASVYGSVTDNNNTITCEEVTSITGGTPYLFRGKYLYPGILKYESSAYGVTGELEGLASVMAAYGTAAGRDKHYFSWTDLSGVFTTSGGVITGTVYNDGVNTWRIPTQSEWDTIINTAPTSTTKVGSTTLSKGFAEIVINLTGSTLAGQGLTTDGIASAGTGIADGVAISRTNYIAGLLLIPDGATVSCPRIKGTVGAAASWSVSTNCITYDDLEILVNGGCVFLPAAGFYNGSSWSGGGSYGSYWSATQHPSNTSNASNLCFYSSNVYAANNDNKSYYMPVRLVRE